MKLFAISSFLLSGNLGEAPIFFKKIDNYRNYKKNIYEKFKILPAKITANETKIKIKNFNCMITNFLIGNFSVNLFFVVL